ncbi:unnamed protein product [Euphydryas editha]|uniref:Androgen-dependent TFPI-regulating protein n=1 Tax=Euphydryas editha TaxID=104508 RepID=A0AAU9V9S6_EUPED|nr:unnamed protein product [Euphydryas editha]
MNKSSDMLLNIRLVFNGVALSHLVFAAIVILPIDMSTDEDPRISIYIRVRWKLITCWCNLMLLGYFLISFYCDCEEKQGKWDGKRVTGFRLFRDYFMTRVIFPSTMLCDSLFWILWHTDPTLIAPMAVFSYLPNWAQHSLHTLSAVKVVVDILLVPRRRPANLLPGIVMMYSFCALYSSV